MKRAILTTMLLSAWLLSMPAAQAQDKKQAKIPDNVEMIRDVEYGTGGERALKLHILRPRETPKEKMPVVVWVHGGGWSAGNKDSGLALLAPFAARGYFCASIEYRLSKEAIFPAQIEDCKCAIRFLRAKAQIYNLDPDRIGVMGASAGGHLVALLGTSASVKDLEGKGGLEKFSSKVQAVCDICGPTDLIKIVGDSAGTSNPVVKLLGGPPAENRSKAELANPITHITKDAPPFLIVHGDKDMLVPLSQSELLRDALKKAGVSVSLYVAEGQGHAVSGPEVTRRVTEFFDQQLKAAK